MEVTVVTGKGARKLFFGAALRHIYGGKGRTNWKMDIHGAGRLIDPVKELSDREQIMVGEAVKQLKVDIKLGIGLGLERLPLDFGGG